MKEAVCNHQKEELDIIELISTNMQLHFVNEVNKIRFHTAISNHLVFHIVEHVTLSLLSEIAASTYVQNNDQDDIGNLADNFTASIQRNKERFIKNVLDAVKTMNDEVKEARNDDTNIN